MLSSLVRLTYVNFVKNVYWVQPFARNKKTNYKIRQVQPSFALNNTIS